MILEKILLVEDDATLALGMEYTLKNEGFQVSVASSLKDARQLFNSEEPQLILLDVMLPDGSGYELCKEIRSRSEVPIIFLTACDEEVNVVLGLDMGGDDYITKPFRVRELVSRIKAVLRRNKNKEKHSDDLMISKDIEVHALQGKVMKKGEEVVLTSMEYKLLLTLMKNANNVIARSAILEGLWDVDGEFVDDNTLSVYVRRLREKIEDDPARQQYIVTVRGMGYSWNEQVRGMNI